MLFGSVLIDPNSSGGFRVCTGPHIVVDHQRVDDTSFVFSATAQMLLAVSASEGINILENTPSILSTLQKNMRATFDRIDALTIIPSHATYPIIDIHIPRLSQPRRHRTSRSQLHTMHRRSMLQDIVDEALAQVSGSLTRAGGANRSLLNRGRAPALL